MSAVPLNVADAVDSEPARGREGLDRRIAEWRRDFSPRNPAESHLIRQAATLTWKIECVELREMELAGPDSSTSDDVAEAERLRRSLLALQREFRMTLDAFWKSRQQATKLLGSECPMPETAMAVAEIPSMDLDAARTAAIPSSETTDGPRPGTRLPAEAASPKAHFPAPQASGQSGAPVSASAESVGNRTGVGWPVSPTRRARSEKKSSRPRDRLTVRTLDKSPTYAAWGGKICVLPETSLLSPTTPNRT